MRGRAVLREKLDACTQEQMFHLLKQHFLGVERCVFKSDLEEKNWVILIENNTGQLLGFSTILCYQTCYQKERLYVVYSGDTIIDSSARHSFALSRIWINTIQQICPINNNERIIWLLICSGYRTYRFLPVYWQQFFPKYDQDTPNDIKNLIDFLAIERFGEYYNRTTGIVRFPKPQSLIPQLAYIPANKLSDPHVHHFTTLNPGYRNGDELICFTFLNNKNLTPAGQKMLNAKHRNTTIDY